MLSKLSKTDLVVLMDLWFPIMSITMTDMPSFKNLSNLFNQRTKMISQKKNLMKSNIVPVLSTNKNNLKTQMKNQLMNMSSQHNPTKTLCLRTILSRTNSNKKEIWWQIWNLDWKSNSLSLNRPVFEKEKRNNEKRMRYKLRNFKKKPCKSS